MSKTKSSLISALNNAGVCFFRCRRYQHALQLFECTQNLQQNDCGKRNSSYLCTDGKDDQSAKRRRLDEIDQFQHQGLTRRKRARLGSKPTTEAAKEKELVDPILSKEEVPLRFADARGLFREEEIEKGDAFFFSEALLIESKDDSSNGNTEKNRAITSYNIAIVHQQVGNLETSFLYFEQALTIMQEQDIDTSTHPLVISALINIGRINFKSGNTFEAWSNFVEALLGSDFTSISQNDGFNHTYDKTVSFLKEEVLPLLNHLTDIYSKPLEEWLLMQSSVISNIAQIYFYSCCLEEAMILCRVSCEIREKIIGKNSYDVAIIKFNMGLISHKQGNLEDAKEYYRAYHKEALKIFGRENELVATVLHQIGLVQSAMSNCTEAVITLSEVLHIRKSIFGNAHFDIAKTLFSLGQIYFEKHHYDDALIFMKNAFHISQEVVNHDHMILVFAMSYIGQISHIHGKISEALLWYNEALAIARRIFGDHFLVIKILNATGNLLLLVGEMETAWKLFDEASNIHFKKIINDDENKNSSGHSMNKKCFQVVASSA